MVFASYFIFLILLLSAQTSLINAFSIAGVSPDLALIFAFYCGIYFQGNAGTIMGGLAGFIQDCLSGGLLGLNTLSKGLIGFFISNLKDKILVEDVPPVCLFLAAASFLDGFIYYLVVVLWKGGVPAGFFAPSLLIFAAYNALVGPLLFFVLNLIRKQVLRKFSSKILRPL